MHTLLLALVCALILGGISYAGYAASQTSANPRPQFQSQSATSTQSNRPQFERPQESVFEMVASPLHLLALTCSMLVLVLADIEAFAWMRGRKKILELVYMRRLHYGAWAGLLTMITTGVILLTGKTRLWGTPQFTGKMLFVGMLVINGILIGRLMHIATRTPYTEVSRHDRIVLMMSGVASVCGWLGAMAIGFILF